MAETQNPPRPKPRGQGRRVKQGTVLAREMAWRRMRKTRVVAAMGCSDRQLYNYMARRIPVPGMELGFLCDLMDMEPEELVDDRRFLREVVERARVADEFDDGW